MANKKLIEENKTRIIKPGPGDIEPMFADWVKNWIIKLQEIEEAANGSISKK